MPASLGLEPLLFCDVFNLADMCKLRLIFGRFSDISPEYE